MIRRRWVPVFSLLVLIGLGFAWLALVKWSTEKVRSSAETFANGDPYCVQVPGDGDYREVRTLADISILNMLVGVGRANHHAVLVVDRGGEMELMHWSHWSRMFRNGVLGPPAIYCTPRLHDLTMLGKHVRSESSSSIIRVEGMTLSIPRSFGPIAKTNSHGVIVYASSPLFEPLKTLPKFGASMSPKQSSAFVEIDFGMTGFLATRLRKDDDSYLVENVGAEVGLNKHLVWYQPVKELPLNRPSNDYFERSPNGEIETLITCGIDAEADCFHSFYRKGWTYTFHHRREFLGDWREIQNRLSVLAESFVISDPAVSFKTEGLFASHFVHKVDLPRCSGKCAEAARR